MAAATQTVPATLSLEEYLNTAYHPDCDFVDGHLEERNVGGTKHGLLQMQLAIWFHLHAEWNLRTIGGQRTKVSESRVRLPDVSVVFDDDSLLEEPRTTPAFIAIEILSADDRMPRVLVRLKDFAAMGVRHIWLLDPIECVAYTYSQAGLRLVEGTRLSVPDSPVFLDLPELFSSLQSRASRGA
jgi:hypothetical protein